MKTRLFFQLLLLVLNIGIAHAAYVPVQFASGLNQDVIANGIGSVAGTTSAGIPVGTGLQDQDLVCQNFQVNAASAPLTFGLPVSGLIGSAATSGVNYQFSPFANPYTGINALVLSGSNSGANGTLTFQTPIAAENLYILVTASVSANLSGTITFSDNTTQLIASSAVPKWIDTAAVTTLPIAIEGIGRAARGSNMIVSPTDGATRLFELSIAILPQNQNKTIASVTLNKNTNSSLIYIFAITVKTPQALCSPPTSPAAINLTATSASLDWAQTGTPISYQIKYGAPGFNVNTAGTSVFTSIKPYALNPPLTPSTSYSYYVRAICGAGDTSAWSPVTNFTTLCNAPAILSKKDSFNCGPGMVTLEATTVAGATPKWYAAATGTVSIGSGNIFVTPSLAATTNYYVEAVRLSSLGQLGRNNTGNAQVTPNNTGQGILFKTLTDINLDSVSVWVVSDTGTIIVQLQNAANATLSTDTFTFSGTGATVFNRVKIYLPVNYTIPTGNNYRILALNGTTVSLGRELNANAPFANYKIDNVISMISSWVNGAQNTANYYYFYNFYVSSACASPRQMVTATIRPLPVVNLGNDTTICPGVSYTFNAGNAGGAYLWSPGGQTTQVISTNAAGTYSVNVTVNGCSKKDTIVITPGTVPVNNLADTVNLCDGDVATLNAGNPGSTYSWAPGSATTQAIDVNSGGNYSVDVKSIHGCKITSSSYVVLRPLPVDNLGNDTAICSSAVILLDAGNPGDSYNWNTGATTQTINAADSGTYAVTVTTSYNCVNSDTIHIAFQEGPRTEGFNFIPRFFEELGKVEFAPLNPMNVSSYEWDFGDGSPLVTVMNPIHVYSASGQYNVTLKVYNECTDFSRSQTINVDLPTGIVNIGGENINFDIYPNPSRSVLNIHNKSTDYEMQDVMVFNALGAMVYHQKADSKTLHQLSVESFSTGIYFVRVLTDKGFVNRQVQVIR